MPCKLTHLDLFSGIGGFALAARWAGFKTVQFVEIDPFCQKVLQKNFPGVPIHDDIKTFRYTERDTGSTVREVSQRAGTITGGSNVDVGYSGQRLFLLTGGFPCQPFSCAGKRRGKEDDRFLWPEMLRVVSEAKPTWVIGENVAGFINMGLDDCISDLENQGYEVQVFIIPACAVGAPHRRDRVWIVANRSSLRCDRLPKGAGGDHARQESTRNGGQGWPIKKSEGIFDATNPNAAGSQIRKMQQRDIRKECPSAFRKPWEENWLEAATRLCRVDDGLPRQVDRVSRLKALGNAIIPQVAYQIMAGIMEVSHAA